MTITAALELALQLMQGAAQLAAIIQKARAEGREDLTAAELANLVTVNDAAAADLAAAIAKAQREGR